MLNNEISSGIYASTCKSQGNDWSLSCLQPFKPQTKPNRFVIRIESFTWLQAAAIPPKISSCGVDSFFLPTLKIIEPKKDRFIFNSRQLKKHKRYYYIF